MEYVSIPRAVSARRVEAWNVDQQSGMYYIPRLHLVYHDVYEYNPKTQLGHRIEVTTAENARVRDVLSVKTQISIVDLRETIRETLFSQQVAQEVMQGVEATLRAPAIGKIEAVTRESLREAVQQSLRWSSRASTSITKTVEQSLEIERKRDHVEHPGEYVTAAPYERRYVDVHAVWFDWLYVAYRRTTFGLRLKRAKSPALPGREKPRKNEIDLDATVVRFSYWHLMPTRGYEVSSENYRMGVVDPAEVTCDIITDDKGKRYRRENYKRVPTLYQLSNHAFPLKYVANDHEWTEEALLEIQEHEPKDSAWAHSQRRPGKKR